jgi:hypothetical protein
MCFFFSDGRVGINYKGQCSVKVFHVCLKTTTFVEEVKFDFVDGEYRKWLLPFKTVDAIPDNSRCHPKQLMPFLRTHRVFREMATAGKGTCAMATLDPGVGFW